MDSSTSTPRMTQDEIRSLSKPSEEMQEVINHHPVPAIEYNDIPTARKESDDLVPKIRKWLGPVEPDLEEIYIDIPTRDAWVSQAILCRPNPSRCLAKGPLIVLYYGGGFMVGNPITTSRFARGFARLFDAIVVSPAYRLAPEYPFPTGVNDAWDALQYAARNAFSLGADPSKGFIIGGTSAGGNFTTVLARRAVEEKLEPALTGHWAAVPALFNAGGDGVPDVYKEFWSSWEQNKEAMIINAVNCESLFSHYKPDFLSTLYNPLSSPMDTNIEVSKAFVQVAGMDLLRDDGIVYSYALQDKGVDVRLIAYPGVPHVFWAFLPQLQQSKIAHIDVAKGIGWLLGVGVDREKAVEAMLTKNNM